MRYTNDEIHEMLVKELQQMLLDGKEHLCMIISAQYLLDCPKCRAEHNDNWLGPLAGANGAESISFAREMLVRFKTTQLLESLDIPTMRKKHIKT